MLCFAAFAPLAEPLQQSSFSYDALDTRVPVVREGVYIVNVKVRPFLLFWIGRDNVGEARITWREGSGGGRAFEFLVGSDPGRAPRRINRWGFIVEELSAEKAEVLAVMKGSNEATIEEAEAQIARQESVSAFRAARTTIIGSRAMSGTMTVHAPAYFTYRELDALLALIPVEPPSVRVLELPPGTEKGFLLALDSLIRASVGPCHTARGAGARDVAPISYLYNHTLYDLSLLSCEYEPEFRTRTDTFAEVAAGQFQVRNRTTKNKTEFRIIYGTSGELREVPVRAVFRPRWWIEVELVLDRSAGGAS